MFHITCPYDNQEQIVLRESNTKDKTEMKQDTIYNSPALNISLLADVQLNELPKATGVVVVHGLGIAESFHDGAVEDMRTTSSYKIPKS